MLVCKGYLTLKYNRVLLPTFSNTVPMKKTHINIWTEWKHIFPVLAKVIVTSNYFLPPTERRRNREKVRGKF